MSHNLHVYVITSNMNMKWEMKNKLVAVQYFHPRTAGLGCYQVYVSIKFLDEIMCVH